MAALPLIRDWLAPRLGERPLIVGISGAQGSGKSTISAALVQLLRDSGAVSARFGRDFSVGIVQLSLDDVYLPAARRRALAARVHPLLATRGVPGTHDLPLLLDILARVRAGRPVALPRFDKRRDDRLPPQRWDRHDRIDLLILEGWCVGARPQPASALLAPINALEAAADPDARWRTHANQALAGQYQRAWNQLDALAFLAAPDWETVPRWRAEQEAAIGGPMDAAALARFCAHYERLTRWQLVDTPRHAGLVLRLDAGRQVVKCEVK
ncbi:MAG: kinase [Sphingomonadales bacterium]|jgi:D-glycerate 3-kinase